LPASSIAPWWVRDPPDRRFRIAAEGPRRPAMAMAASTPAATQLIARCERWIRENSEQWLWFIAAGGETFRRSIFIHSPCAGLRHNCGAASA
jgi:hypothetical protein